jgi:hypothetical protein
MKNEREEAIEVLEQMIEAEYLVIETMEQQGEKDIDRRVLRALVTALNDVKAWNNV